MYNHAYYESMVHQIMTENQDRAARQRLIASLRPRRRSGVLKALARLGNQRLSRQPRTQLTPGLPPAA